MPTSILDKDHYPKLAHFVEEKIKYAENKIPKDAILKITDHPNTNRAIRRWKEIVESKEYRYFNLWLEDDRSTKAKHFADWNHLSNLGRSKYSQEIGKTINSYFSE